MAGAFWEWPSAHAHDDSNFRWPLRLSDAGGRASKHTLCAPCACWREWSARTTSIRKWRPAPQVASISEPNIQVHEMFLDPADAAHVQICRQPNLGGRSVPVQIPQRFEALGPQPTRCLRVVPSPCPCHEPAKPLSSILCGVLLQLSTDRAWLRQSGSTCGETLAYYCVFARTVAQKSWPAQRHCKS